MDEPGQGAAWPWLSMLLSPRILQHCPQPVGESFVGCCDRDGQTVSGTAILVTRSAPWHSADQDARWFVLIPPGSPSDLRGGGKGQQQESLSSNPYIVVLGPAHSSLRRFSPLDIIRTDNGIQEIKPAWYPRHATHTSPRQPSQPML